VNSLILDIQIFIVFSVCNNSQNYYFVHFQLYIYNLRIMCIQRIIIIASITIIGSYSYCLREWFNLMSLIRLKFKHFQLHSPFYVLNLTIENWSHIIIGTLVKCSKYLPIILLLLRAKNHRYGGIAHLSPSQGLLINAVAGR